MDSEEYEREVCENCDYTGPLEKYGYGHPRKSIYLCNLCASTFFSKATKYPDQVCDTALYRSLAIAFNMVLDELRDIKAQLAALQEDAHDGHPDNAHV